MRLHHSLLKRRGSKGHGKQGFTLVELLIAATLGSLVTITASNIIVGQLRTGGNLSATQSVRQDWNRMFHLLLSALFESALKELKG